MLKTYKWSRLIRQCEVSRLGITRGKVGVSDWNVHPGGSMKDKDYIGRQQCA